MGRPSTPFGPYPWEPGGAWDTSPQTPAAPATPPDTSKRQAIIDQFAKDHQGQIGGASTVYNKPTAAQTAAATTPQQRQQLQSDMDSGFDLYTFGDGTTIELSPDGQSRNYNAAPATSQNANNPAPVATNTTDQFIVMRDPKTGQTSTVANPNYKPAGPTSVSTNTTDQFIVTRNADGTTKTEPNPNYKPPSPTSVSTNTTDQFIVTRNADGTTKTEPNPNYRPPTPTSVATNTTDQFIVTRNADGTTKTEPNPNYQPAAAAPIATNTTDQFIVMRDPKTGNTTTVANPNYQKPAGAVVGSPGTNDQFIMTRDPASGALSQQPNPNYVPPKPTQITPSSTTPFITSLDPTTGALTSQPNPSYLPADPGHMIQQLQQQAQAQQQTLKQQVASGKLTPDQAAQQFDQWYGTNVEPFKGQIAAAQTAQQQAIQKGQADIGYTQAQTANIPATLANTASNDAQARVISMMPYLANANAPALMQQAVPGGGGKFNPGALMQAATYSLPNLQEVGRLGAAQALANFSPTAQAHLAQPGPPGQPPVGGMPDLNSLIGQNQFTFGQPPPPAAPAPGAPPPATAQVPQNPVYPGLAQGAVPWGTYQPGWQPGQPVAPNGGW